MGSSKAYSCHCTNSHLYNSPFSTSFLLSAACVVCSYVCHNVPCWLFCVCLAECFSYAPHLVGSSCINGFSLHNFNEVYVCFVQFFFQLLFRQHFGLNFIVGDNFLITYDVELVSVCLHYAANLISLR